MSEELENAEKLVRYYKYFKQSTNPYLTFTLDFGKIKTKDMLNRYHRVFEKLNKIVKKYNINYANYIRYCVIDLKIKEPKELILIDNFVRYANFLKIKKQYKKIYTMYMKSANYVAERCIEENVSPKDYINGLIVSNTLANHYFCGDISEYYIATIQNFKNIYRKLDNINRDELRIIYNVAEELNQQVQETFMMFKNHTVKPLSLTEQIIQEKLKQTNKGN